MSLSSCEKCWDNPCTCGHQYRSYTPQARIELAAAVLGMSVEALVAALPNDAIKAPPAQK